MNTNEPSNTENRKALIAFIICLVVIVTAVVVASLTQRDFGNVEVKNVTYPNFHLPWRTVPGDGISIWAKLLKPVEATQDKRMPGAFVQTAAVLGARVVTDARRFVQSGGTCYTCWK